MEQRLAVWFYALSLLGSLSTAAATFYVRAEVMELRVMIVERINEAGRDYMTRREYDSLEGRVSQLETRSHEKP